MLSCSRCGGNARAVRETDGNLEVSCLQCGHRQPERPREPAPIRRPRRRNPFAAEAKKLRATRQARVKPALFRLDAPAESGRETEK